MIITCPCEKKQFKIDSSLIPQDGRELQCGSCERVWFFKPKNESEAPLTLNENISENKIELAIENNEQILEFSENLQKEKLIEPEIKNKTSKEIPNKVKKLENENKGSKFFFGPSNSLSAHPDLPLAYKTGKSNCSSLASKLTNKSKVSSNTSFAL